MFNQCQFIGNLGRDPEIFKFESGGEIAKTSIAVTETYYVGEEKEKRQHTEWIQIIFRYPLVDTAMKYLKKGSKIFIQGQLRQREFETANQTKKTITEIHVRNFIFLD
jgi:single-strand DNA-binding protein